ncbi:MAG: hypothetical protein IRZ16_05405 [Myxococcaceae bacterium]|nr:hypothetical protein [Myxococcaceae bacterium]
MQTKTIAAAVVTTLMTLGLAGCGSNPGSGTQTLWVKAQAISDGDPKNTAMLVEVRQGSSDGELITDAVVTIVGDETGEFNLPWQGANLFGWKFGSYYKELTWDTGWQLTVKRGQDALDAYLVAPGITTITQPLDGSTFDRSQGEPLVVKWKDGYGRRAESSVAVDFERAPGQADKSFTREDPLELEVEANNLVATDHERVTVTRKNEIALAGGVPGSTFSAETHHRVEFIVK